MRSIKRVLKISRDSASGKTFFEKIRARVDEGHLANSSRADFRFNHTRALSDAPWAGALPGTNRGDVD